MPTENVFSSGRRFNHCDARSNRMIADFRMGHVRSRSRRRRRKILSPHDRPRLSRRATGSLFDTLRQSIAPTSHAQATTTLSVWRETVILLPYYIIEIYKNISRNVVFKISTVRAHETTSKPFKIHLPPDRLDHAEDALNRYRGPQTARKSTAARKVSRASSGDGTIVSS